MARWSIVVAGSLGALGLPAPPTAFAASVGAPSQLDLAAMPAVKLVVTSGGWQHVSQPALVAAGLAPGVDPARLQLFADGVEEALSITGNGDAVFDSGEAIEFYGQGRDTLWTGARTYWLVVGTVGRRVPLVVYPASGSQPQSFPGAAVLRQRTNYFAALKNGDASNFFGDVVASSGVTETVTVTHVDRAQAAGLQVVLQGITAGNHQVAISLNGRPVGVCAFAGQAAQTCAISPVSVLEGANDVLLVGQGDSPDQSLVASVEIDYPHQFVADGERAQPDRAVRHADRHLGVLVARRAGDGRERSDPPDRARDQRDGRRVELHGHGEHAGRDLLAGALRLHPRRRRWRRRWSLPAARRAGRSRAPARW